ncbi:MAG: Fic family protein [Dysgonamonadaceae bacterium]|jgi:Fic family protein|nr:Fic family protein [Dysgonamonadaceae bacterium]
MYNWQFEKWANFIYNEEIISTDALKFAELSGEIFGIFKTFGSAKQQNEILDIMISEAIKTSEIEGEMLSREDVRSSFLKQLGLTTTIKNIKDRRAENVALLMLDVRNNFQTKLSEKLIKEWHGMLFLNAKYIRAGVYRSSEEPMQIVSGPVGKEKVHFEAPPAKQVPQEMKNFVKWYNSFKTNGNIQKIILKTAITHIYFESIHPFEDGNGRIGRALIEKCLSESLGRQIIMSISQTIGKDKNKYYEEMKRAQSTLEIDRWLLYFSQLLIDAQQNALDILDFSLRKTQFFDKYKSTLNERQTKVINKMLEDGKDGFEGGMTAKKYISIAKTTKATATRDLTELVKLGIFEQNLAGRSTNYTLDL